MSNNPISFQKKKKYSISFFLGAGASAAFGYPTTTVLKESSIEYVTTQANSTYNPNVKTRLLTMLPLLRHRGFPDIEYIFQFLKEVSKKNIPEVYNFFTSNIFSGQLEAMSGSVTGVEAGKYFEYCDFFKDYLTKYLFSVFKWRESNKDMVEKIYSKLFSLAFKDSHIVHVFTTNYDSIIERYCLGNIKVIDGFKYDENSDRSIFNLESFGTENESEIASSKKRLFLYKLHGSLTWKKFSDSKIIKMLYNEDHPQKDAINGITLVSPTRTPKDTESDPPYTELIELFKNRIQDFDVCIVVGYSFRDSLNEKFMDFLSKKEKLLIVISPEATPNIMMNFLKKKIMLSSEIPPEAYKCEQIKEGIQFINEPNILLINNYMSSETIDDILRIICGFLYNGNTDTA